ncbi:MAG: hypothetical protein KME42_16665 [Tildeniella nuda ZEHNDER 1965/U140]|jgi:hypothetical protein|nr:hypothetical protein [Tildeniella nuda ZEHNDER 1965/U140]
MKDNDRINVAYLEGADLTNLSVGWLTVSPTISPLKQETGFLMIQIVDRFFVEKPGF